MRQHAMNGTTRTRGVIAAGALVVAIATMASARSETIRQPLASTGADADAFGEAKAKIRSRASGLSGKLDVRGRRLDSARPIR